MGLKLLLSVQTRSSEDPSDSASASLAPRTGCQDRQASQQSSRLLHGVAVSPTSTEQNASASLTSAIEVKTVRRARASIQNRQQVSAAGSAGPKPGRLAAARRKDYPEASSGDSASDASQNGSSSASWREGHLHSSSSDPSAATDEISTSAIRPRRGLLHPPSDILAAKKLSLTRPWSERRTTLSESSSPIFQPGPSQEQRVVQPSTNVKGSIPGGRSQPRSASSLPKYESWPGQTIPPGIGKIADRDGATSSKGNPQDDSVAAVGDQFFPPPINGEVLLPGFDKLELRGDARSPAGKIGIGIEVEFLLKALEPEDRRSTLGEFTDTIARKHNISVRGHHPRMRNEVFNFLKRTRFDKWVLTTDASMSTHREPWGIEMLTPLFVAFPRSPWRSHVQATWKFLQQHYEITDNKNCGTHVHISVEGGYSLEDVKRVASASIHFDTAFEALVPETRRGRCEFARSMWIDARKFAAKGRSRAEAILMINSVTDFHAFSSLVQPYTLRGYVWNFRSILKYYTIEFRKPPASKTADEALGWAELAMSFVQSSIRYGSPERLRLIPPTVGGLRWFLRQNHIARSNEPERLDQIWAGKDPNAFVEGIPLEDVECPEGMEKIAKMIERDRRDILKQIHSTQEPYWPE
ncbi:hypothetical protein GJ744_001919 [Endocarpon pusillum]|uniref:Amidoligase enzyme n=1 Tax=Endocarpon pusillum TaxID=364733 RepID=A0A8H7EA50_9EURO|nr:hypothetical protein GJ744_001919 [Endocarpon pusillum]